MRDLDYSALGRGRGIGARMRALAGDPLMLMGTTVVVLLVLVPAVALVAILASGAPRDGGMLAFLGMLLAGGIYGLVDVWRKTTTSGGVEAFAEANRLDVIRSLEARDYGAHRFRTGSRIVQESMRTRQARFIEIGDAWPMTPVRLGISASAGVSARDHRSPEVFLRARLSGPVRAPLVHDGREGPDGSPGQDGVLPTASQEAPFADPPGDAAPARPDGADRPFITPAMDRDLRAFAGPYTLEITGQELVLCGSRPLDASRAGRVREAVILVDALASRSEALLLDGEPGAPRTAATWSSAIGQHGAAPPMGRRRHPLVVVLMVLAMLIVIPLGLAVVMSSIDHLLLGREVLAKVAVGILVVAILGIVLGVARWFTAARPARPDRRRPPDLTRR